jgi:peptidoglycan/LPS O-acetylase OafA/YrhL
LGWRAFFFLDMKRSGRDGAEGEQKEVLCQFGPCWFHRHRPRFKKIFAPLFSKSGCFPLTEAREITDLTICRAFFAAWVFCYHVDLYLGLAHRLGPFAGWLGRGYLGVDGFFLLSGLILAHTHREFSPGVPGRFAPQAWRFYGSRLARIYPVHAATLCLLAALLLLARMHGVFPREASRFGLAPLLENVALIQGWGFADVGGWNYPSWSISTEWAGYLLFPLIWWALCRCGALVAGHMVLVSFLILGLLVSWHHNSLNFGVSQGLLRFFPEFLVGMGTARLLPHLAGRVPARGLALAGLALVAAGAECGRDWLAALGLWLLLAGFVTRHEAGWPPLLGRPAALLAFGRLSYAFYMSFAIAELLLVNLFRRHGWVPTSHPGVFAGGMFTMTLALAVALHLAVERPSRQESGRFLKKAAPKTFMKLGPRR